MKHILIATLALCAAAQTPSEPPGLIRVIRGETKSDPIQAYVNSRAATPVIGMNAVSGTAETWLLELHDSFASIEDVDRTLGSADPARVMVPDADGMLTSSRKLIAIYRPGLSYRGDQAIRMFPRAHYFHVSIYRVRTGADVDFAELVKLRRFSLDSINLDRPDIAYQVISGGPSGTYIFLAPLVSLKTLDEGRTAPPPYAQAAADKALKKFEESEIGREHLLFRVEPRLSYVSDEFANVDAEFWRPK